MMRGGVVEYLTVCLDVAGVVALTVFAFLIWAPLALLMLGAFALLASWSLSKRLPAPPDQGEVRHPATVPVGDE